MGKAGQRNKRQSLGSQPGQFWLGAFMAAEAPLCLVVMMLPDTRRAALLGWVLSGPTTLLLSIGVLTALGVLVGFVAHRLGCGD